MNFILVSHLPSRFFVIYHYTDKIQHLLQMFVGLKYLYDYVLEFHLYSRQIQTLISSHTLLITIVRDIHYPMTSDQLAPHDL